MALTLLHASQFAAAALMMGLAAWLLAINFSSRLNRAFALFLFLRAMVIVVNRGGDAVPGLDVAYLQRVSPYFLIGAGFALAYFALVYPRPAWGLSPRAVLFGTLVTAGVVEVAYAVDHCLVVCASASGDRVGPLVAFALLLPIVSGLAALRLARASRDGGPGSSALRTVALGFVTAAAMDGALSLSVMLAARDAGAGFAGEPWRYLPHLFISLSLVPVIGYAIVTRRVVEVRRRWIALATMGAAAATGAIVGTGITGGAAVFFLGVWRFVLGAIIAYALLRQSLFDIDSRLRFTLKQSTVGALFIAVFVVVSEIGSELVSEQLGGYLGAGAALLLVFALAPLQLFAEKLVRTALPRPPPGRGLPPDTRYEIYREQAALSWADGALDRGERVVLERLREALGLTAEEASRIELEIAKNA